jgi:2-octaprenyl-6-methoxyphenol hydroxylase
MNTTPVYDLVIVGGGMVGASLALALGGRGLRTALIEAHAPGDPGQPGYDDRAIALAYGTRRVFEAIGVWPALRGQVEPIADIHVSERGRFGLVRLSAREEGVAALGYVVTARELGAVLMDRLVAVPDLDLLAPARLIDFADDGALVTLQVERDGVMHTLATRLLVAADGGDSPVRERLGVPVRRWEYGQTAVVANVTPGRPHLGRAYERFTDSGPLALLPMTGGRCAVVWTVRDDDVDGLLALDDAAFLAGLQVRFGHRLGMFERAGRRHAYPLGLMRALESVRGRVAIIGNAAHTLHPVAGQGFNLGVRDVAALAEVVDEAHRAGLDPGAPEVLEDYRRWRQREQAVMAVATDGLARLFANPLGPLRLGRHLGLLAMAWLPGARHPLARAAMGLAGRQPRLARGVPLG